LSIISGEEVGCKICDPHSSSTRTASSIILDRQKQKGVTVSEEEEGTEEQNAGVQLS